MAPPNVQSQTFLTPNVFYQPFVPYSAINLNQVSGIPGPVSNEANLLQTVVPTIVPVVKKTSTALQEVQNVIQNRVQNTAPSSGSVFAGSLEQSYYCPILPKPDVTSTSTELAKNNTVSNRKKKARKLRSPSPVSRKVLAVPEKISSPGNVNDFGKGMHCNDYNYRCKNKERTR